MPSLAAMPVETQVFAALYPDKPALEAAVRRLLEQTDYGKEPLVVPSDKPYKHVRVRLEQSADVEKHKFISMQSQIDGACDAVILAREKGAAHSPPLAGAASSSSSAAATAAASSFSHVSFSHASSSHASSSSAAAAAVVGANADPVNADPPSEGSRLLQLPDELLIAIALGLPLIERILLMRCSRTPRSGSNPPREWAACHVGICTWAYARGHMHVGICTWAYARGHMHVGMLLVLRVLPAIANPSCSRCTLQSLHPAVAAPCSRCTLQSLSDAGAVCVVLLSCML